MQGDNIDKMLALEQWERLKDTIENLGITVELLRPNKNLPDMVFAANGGLVHQNKVVLSNFRHSERISEYSHYRQWFLSQRYQIHTLDPQLKFEGQGDAIIHNNTIIGGFGFRSELRALEKVADIYNMNLIPLKLKDPRFYHLDTCLAILDKENGLGIFYPGAFENTNISSLTNLKLIKVPEGEAKKFVCNSLAYKNNVLMPANNNWTAASLKKLNYNVFMIETSEYLKAGGSVQCLSLWV